MASKKLQLEVTKTLKDTVATVQSYDSRWQDLRELNIAVEKAEKDVLTSPDTARPAVKGKKNAVRAGTQESLDLKHARDSRGRIEWDLAAFLRRLHRFRQSIADWMSHPDLRHQQGELAALKKTLDLRYKRGRAFYSEGRCSDPSGEIRDGVLPDLPPHHLTALSWVDAFLGDLRRQRRLFSSEMASLQSSPSQQAPLRSRIKPPKTVETQQSPPKLTPGTRSRNRRGKNAHQETKLPKEITELENNTVNVTRERMSSVERTERIGILEGLSHIHRLHISRLTAVRSGLLYQSLNAPTEFLDQLRNSLDPYIHDNDSGALVLGEEVYESLCSLPGETFDQHLQSDGSSSASSTYSTSANETREEIEVLFQEALMTDSTPKPDTVLPTPEEIIGNKRVRQRSQSFVEQRGKAENSTAASMLPPVLSDKCDKEKVELPVALDNEGLTAASTEAESDVPSCEALTDEGSSCLQSPALPQYHRNHHPHLNYSSSIERQQLLQSAADPDATSLIIRGSLLSAGHQWESSPWRYWEGPWLNRPVVSPNFSQETFSCDDPPISLSNPLLHGSGLEKFPTYDSQRNIWGPIDPSEWIQPVLICQINVNFDGHRISRRQLPPQLNTSPEYLKLSCGDCIEVFLRQPGGWAFGRSRQEINGYEVQKRERMGWFPEWLTHEPFSKIISDEMTNTKLRFRSTLQRVRSPIIFYKYSHSSSLLPKHLFHLRTERNHYVQQSSINNNNLRHYGYHQSSSMHQHSYSYNFSDSCNALLDYSPSIFRNSTIPSRPFSTRAFHPARHYPSTQDEQLIDALVDQILLSSKFSNTTASTSLCLG